MKAIDPARNALYGLLSWLAPFLLALVVTPIVVRGLGAESYGLYSLIVGLGAYALGLMSAQPVIREVAAYRAGDRMDRIGSLLSTAALLTITIGSLVACCLWFGAVWISTSLLQVAPESQHAAVLGLRLFALAVPLAMLTQVFSAVPQGFQRFDGYGRTITSMAVVLLGGNAFLAATGAELVPLVAWYSIATAISCGAFFVVARRLVPGAFFGRPLDASAMKALIRFGASVSARQTIANLLLLFERAWIVRTLGAAALTFYVIPMILALNLHAFVANSALSFYPLASEAHAQGDITRLRMVYSRALKIAAPLIGLPVVTLVVAGGPLLALWLGPDFAERSGPVLTLHAVTFGILALMVVPWQTADALGRPGWNASLSLVWLLGSGGLMIWLTPRFGVEGAAAARLLGMAAVPFYVARIEKWLFDAVLWRFWARTLALLMVAVAGAGGMEAALLLWLPSAAWTVFVAIGAGALVFVACLWGLAYFDRGEREWLKERLGALAVRSSKLA